MSITPGSMSSAARGTFLVGWSLSGPKIFDTSTCIFEDGSMSSNTIMPRSSNSLTSCARTASSWMLSQVSPETREPQSSPGSRSRMVILAGIAPSPVLCSSSCAKMP